MSNILKKLSREIINSSATGALSPSSIIQLCLISQQKYIIELSRQQMVEVSQIYTLLYDMDNVLVFAKDITGSPSGFDTPLGLLNKRSLNIVSDKTSTYNLILREEGLSTISVPRKLSLLTVDNSTTFDNLIHFLSKTAFDRVDKIMHYNQYCIKGGIVEFYSISSIYPLRVSFLDDDPIISYFDLDTGLNHYEKLRHFTLRKGGDGRSTILIDHLKTSCGLTSLKIDVGKSIEGSALEVSYSTLQNNKMGFKPIYSSDIITSIIQYKKHIIVPNLYKNINYRTHAQNTTPFNYFMLGDLVCHINYGIAEYVGLTSLPGSSGEVINLKYRDGSLYVTINEINKLTFVSRETEENNQIAYLSKQKKWLKRRALIKEGVLEYIQTIIEGYVQRTSTKRPPWIKDDLENNFIGGFKHKDTIDQYQVWSDIQKDFTKHKPMNRLLCGDVGFGKTEIAMRAAFRVVINGGKVLILVPTATLLIQHKMTFEERFEGFPVNFGFVRGGLKTNVNKKILNNWLGGDIDILIGTHTLLNNKLWMNGVSFFIIDEEHRFGVKQKNIMLDHYVNKDFLWLSATPIPRSLHLSFLGVSQISTMNSPPLLRKPIQTVVASFSDKLIKHCILNELSRKGQCFIVHNNIKELNIIESKVLRLVPNIITKQFHSKLSSKESTLIFNEFLENRIQVLICTSIIGMGLDVHNAGTIIINNAHMFGLSELHQLRGRVGRGEVQSFAYLLLPNNIHLTRPGYKRLKTIEKNNLLGANYNIAKSDLTIRGPGALFGYKQSGYGLNGGYELYSKILSGELSNKFNINNFHNLVDKCVYNVPFSCYIPDNYIIDEVDRLNYYKNIDSKYSVKGVMFFMNTIKSQYGVVPAAVENLLYMRCVVFVVAGFGCFKIVVKDYVLTLSCDDSFIKFKGNLNVALLKGWVLIDCIIKNNIYHLSFQFIKGCLNASLLYLFVEKLKKDCFDG